MEVLKDIPVELDKKTLFERAHIDPDSSDAREFERLLEKARAVARPKAVYRESFIDAKGEGTVTIEGVTFSSRTLRTNLDKVERVFAYVATCGHELDGIDLSGGDFMAPFWLDTIKAAALGLSIGYLKNHLDRRFALGKTSTMSPGAGDVTVWPIEQQRALFSLFGDVEGLIGVRLTDSFLMIPNKTVSGIRFPTEVDFRACQLCRRKVCPGRSAPFDKALWDAVQHGTDAAPPAVPDGQ